MLRGVILHYTHPISFADTLSFLLLDGFDPTTKVCGSEDGIETSSSKGLTMVTNRPTWRLVWTLWNFEVYPQKLLLLFPF
jgi:hypothetical protein